MKVWWRFSRGLQPSLRKEQYFELGQENELARREEACEAKDTCTEAFETVLPRVFRGHLLVRVAAGRSGWLC